MELQDKIGEQSASPRAIPDCQESLGPSTVFTIIAMICMTSSPVSVSALEPLFKQPLPPPEVRAEKDAPTYEFNMNGKPWKEVLMWLNEKTGLPIVGITIPPDPFVADFVPGRKYTIAEIINIVNKAPVVAGQKEKYYLVKREREIVVMSKP